MCGLAEADERSSRLDLTCRNSVGPPDGFGEENCLLVFGLMAINCLSAALLAVAAVAATNLNDVSVFTEERVIIDAVQVGRGAIEWRKPIPLTHTKSNARPAISGCLINPRVFRSEFMATPTMGLIFWMTACFCYVISGSKGYKMFRVDARPVLAFVMYLKAGRNGPHKHLVG